MIQLINQLAWRAQITIDANRVGVPRVNTNEATLQSVLTTIFVIIGGISVLFVLIGGLRYAMSNGNASSAQQAKDTILYAMVGVVVASAATIIVQFVLGSLLT